MLREEGPTSKFVICLIHDLIYNLKSQKSFLGFSFLFLFFLQKYHSRISKTGMQETGKKAEMLITECREL